MKELEEEMRQDWQLWAVAREVWRLRSASNEGFYEFRGTPTPPNHSFSYVSWVFNGFYIIN